MSYEDLHKKMTNVQEAGRVKGLDKKRTNIDTTHKVLNQEIEDLCVEIEGDFKWQDAIYELLVGRDEVAIIDAIRHKLQKMDDKTLRKTLDKFYEPGFVYSND